ncbi:UNVERIFIED_CONTAM: Succinate dehydrogenase assembly factor 2, mitochondrial [Sesamum angustifolium]|uniref:Succinate dehydrogenase assembly factor 2, mitochondrial n=1 Tax=Sesamum angustifolium TaxID=2727405 RepID=A0AAW2LL97_9LAMI
MASLRRALFSTVTRIISSNRIIADHNISLTGLFWVPSPVPTLQKAPHPLISISLQSKRTKRQENPDLWKWLTGQEQPPEEVNANPVFASVKERVTNNLDNHAAPETRATPGQSWVRGWDDFKKGRDSPIAGNQ